MTTYEAISVAFQSNLVLIGLITVIIMIVSSIRKTWHLPSPSGECLSFSYAAVKRIHKVLEFLSFTERNFKGFFKN